MKVIAKTLKGREFIYKAESVHKVNPKNAGKVVGILNQYAYRLKDGETWHVYDIDEYDVVPYAYAETQRFVLSKDGTLKDYANAGY